MIGGASGGRGPRDDRARRRPGRDRLGRGGAPQLGDRDAGAGQHDLLDRLDDRGGRAAAHAGHLLGDPGPGLLGLDLLHRGERGDAAGDRLARRAPRPPAPVPRRGRRLHGVLAVLRHGQLAAGGGPAADRAGRLRRVPDPALAGDHARCLPARGARQGDGVLGHGRGARAGDRADARRLSDRRAVLALGVLHQHPGRLAGAARRAHLPAQDAARAAPAAARRLRLRRARARRRRDADDARPRRAPRLVRIRARS